MKRLKLIFAIIPMLLLCGCSLFNKTTAPTNAVTNATTTEKKPHVHDCEDVYSYDKDFHYHICKGCFAQIDKELHNADDGVVSVEPTLTSEGVKTYTCKVCGYKWTESVPKLKESYNLRFLDWDGTVLDEVSVKCGEDAYTIAQPEYEGMVFKGWDKDITNVKADMDVYAVYGWIVNFYNFDNTIVETQIIENGKSAVLPDNPTRTGYRFDKWDKSLKNITKNTDIYAEFVKQYKVSFLNYDNSVYQTVTVDEGESVNPIEGPTRDGYTFIEWEGSLTNIKKNETITPKYTISTCKVDFKVGTTLVETQVVSYGQKANAPTEVFVDWSNSHCYRIKWNKEDYSSITTDTVVQAESYTIIDKEPVIYVDSIQTDLSKEYATVNLYIFGPINAYGISIGLSYDERLSISNDDVTVDANFTVGGNAAVGYNVDTKNKKITFSWIEGNGKNFNEGQYIKVLSFKFGLDTKLQSGNYDVTVNSEKKSTYFVGDSLNDPISPVIVSGGIKID